MSELIPANFGAVSTRFSNVTANDDLSSGVQSSFGIVGYKGKVWSIRYRGDETPLMRDDGDGPKGSIEVVIIKASPFISKIWYENGYVEGSSAAPDCFSNNGVTPEPTSAKPQCAQCAACPHNQWGSRVTPAGKAGKSCADSKRLAVVPLQDINNEMFGGPMLMRVPAASLQDVAMYGQKMQQMGYPYFSVGTKISFDQNESYPKFIFKGLRPLTDDEADVVMGLRDSHTVERIMAESEYGAPATSNPAKDEEPLFEQAPDVGAKEEPKAEPVKKAPAKATTKKAEPKTEPAPKVEPETTSTPSVNEESDDEDEEDAEVAAMLAKAAALKQAKAEKAAREKAEAEAADRKIAEEFAAKAHAENEARAKAAAAKNAGPSAEELEAARKAEEKKRKREEAARLLAEAEAEDEDTSEGNTDEEDGSLNVASGFEADLDKMLADLLP